MSEALPIPPSAGQPSPHWELLEAIFYHSTDGLFVIDDKMRVVLYNPAAAEMTGWAGSDPIAIGCRVLQGKACPIPEGSVFNPAECPGPDVLLNLHTSHRNELVLVDRHGRQRHVEVTYTPVRGAGGALVYILGTLRDIEERRELEDQLLQSRKLASLGTLVAGIAHELRNPLGIIMSAVEILANEDRTLPQRREAVRLLLDETRRLDKSIREFLAFARPRPARREPTDVVALMRRFTELHRANHAACRLVITERYPEERLPRAALDADLMRQVCENLLANAEESRPASDGPVHLEISVARHDERHVRIDFTDDGLGIDPEQIPKIFDPFFTTKRDGTGLGLSIVHQIVSDHRGRIGVHSRPGAGTTFSISLPFAEEIPL